MAVTLRLSRTGQKNRPFYRIVAATKTAKRDGRFLEIIGNYDNRVNPPRYVLKEDKVKKWLGSGALPSQLVRDLIVKSFPGLIEGQEKNRLAKIQAARKKRKQRSAKKKR